MIRPGRAFRWLQGVIALAALSALVGCERAPRVSSPLEGQTLPELEMSLLGGGELRSEDLQGGDVPIVLNFWATWCGPCIREIPTLQELHRSGEVKVVSISLDNKGSERKVGAFVEHKEIEYPVLLGNMAYFQQVGGTAIPYTLVLDPDLVIAAAHRGLVSKHALEQDLARAMSSRG